MTFDILNLLEITIIYIFSMAALEQSQEILFTKRTSSLVLKLAVIGAGQLHRGHIV